MHKIRLFALCACVAAHSLQAPKRSTITQKGLQKIREGLVDLPARPFATDVITIFVDPGEPKGRELGAISAPLAAALTSNKNIIITTAGLLADIVRVGEQHLRAESWKAYQLVDTPDIYVLIPKSYTPARELNQQLGENFRYGLHLEKLQKIDKGRLLSADFHAEQRGKEKNFSRRLVNGIKHLFLNKSEWGEALAQQGYDDLKTYYRYAPIFAFYLVGHGAQFSSIDQELLQVQKLSAQEGEEKWAETIRYLQQLKTEQHALYDPQSRGVIAGIEGGYFEKLLTFFNTKLQASLVFYDTCFGGGWNLEELVKEQAYSYTLISGAIMGAELLGFSEAKEFHFDEFTALLTSFDPIDFERVLGTIYFFAALGRQAQKASNIPLIVFPGQKPVPLDMPGQVVSIGQALAKSRDASSPLHISTFFAGRYLSQEAAAKASKAAIKKEELRKELYAKWLHSKGIKEQKGIKAAHIIDPKVYKEWLLKLKKFNEQYPTPAKHEPPSHVYPHAILLYAEKIPFPLIIDKNPTQEKPHPPALIPMSPFTSFSELTIEARDFTISQVVQDMLLNFPSLEENRTFMVKVIAKNDVDALGAHETRVDEKSYFMVLAVNIAPQSGLNEGTLRNAIIVRYDSGVMQGAVELSIQRQTAEKPARGKKQRAGSGKKEKGGRHTTQTSEKPDILNTEPIAESQIRGRWDKLLARAEEASARLGIPRGGVSPHRRELPPGSPLDALAYTLMQLSEGGGR